MNEAQESISKNDQRKLFGSRPERAILIFFVALAVVSRIGYARLERVVKWDESDYLMLGRNLFSGRGFTTAGYPEVHYPPLLPMLFGLTYTLTHQPELASNIWYILFGALLLLPYYRLACRIYDRQVGLLAIALLLAFPALTIGVLYWGTMSEPLYLFLVYTGLYAIWRAGEEGWLRHYALAGLAFALAYLARPEGILYFALCFLFIMAWQATPHRLWRGNSILGIGVYVAIFLFCALPYVFYLHQHTGRWTFSGKVGVTLALGEAVIEKDPQAYDVATASLDSSGHHLIWFSPERFREPGMLAEIRSNPTEFGERVLANVRLWASQFTRKTIFPSFLWSLVMLGWFQAPWSSKRARKELFLSAAVLPPFAFLALHIEIRFFAPVFPVLLLWTAKGLDVLGHWLQKTVQVCSSDFSRHREAGKAAEADTGNPPLNAPLRILPLCCILLYFLLMGFVMATAAQEETDFSLKRAGLWLRDHAPTDAAVMSRDVAVAVYAERRWVPSPHAEYEAYLSYARYHAVDYLVISEREATVLRPMLSFLLDEAHPPAGLELVHVEIEEPSEKGRALVYRIR